MINTAIRMPIHITAHNLSLSLPLCEFVRKKIGAVARFANDVLAVEIVLRRNPSHGSERFSVSARIALPGHDIHSHAAAPDIYVAVGLAAAKLARRLRKRKTRLSKTYSVRSENRRAISGAEQRTATPPRRATPEDHEWIPAVTQESGDRTKKPRVFLFRRRTPLSLAPTTPA